MNMIIEIDNRIEDHSLVSHSIQLRVDCGAYGCAYGCAHDWDGKRYGSMETNNLCNCNEGDETVADPTLNRTQL